MSPYTGGGIGPAQRHRRGGHHLLHGGYHGKGSRKKVLFLVDSPLRPLAPPPQAKLSKERLQINDGAIDGASPVHLEFFVCTFGQFFIAK